ncbi:MAG: DUF2586 domain-containing protein [Proteobacteria bacterium]|nr:DUF2586 domain-containing protein [Pseudomonadota bacterium]
MGDVLEYLIDGTSGLAPGGVEGTAIIAGVCSDGQIGKGYLLGKSSDLTGLLGVGPLAAALRDAFATGGQNPILIAVPVAGLPGGYLGTVNQAGTGPEALVSGVAVANANVVVEIVDAGVLGTATYKLSEDDGSTWGGATAIPANGQISVGDTGATLVLASGDYASGDSYSFVVRTSIGPVSKVGTGPDITVAGTVRAAAQVELLIMSAGGRNKGTYMLSVDGGDSWGGARTLPTDGAISVGSTGAVITWPASDAVAGDTYTFNLLAPVPSISSVVSSLERPLELFDVEFVHVVGESDSVDWAALGVISDEQWNKHRPLFFTAETRLPQDNEDLSDWAAELLADRQGVAHRFVSPVSVFGEVSDSTGKRQVRNWGGLLAGRMVSIPVMRAVGRVRDGGITQGTLPEAWNEAVQTMLEAAGFVTAKHYAGMSSAFWGDARTLAEDTSDFRYLVVVRTVFKAVRKARIACLKSMYDEAGDPLQEGGGAGLAFLQASIENALNTMVAAIPKELAGFVVEIPDGQDIANNGVAVEQTLIGIPIIRKIKLYSRYVYAGGAFDPRLEGTN